MCNTYTWQKAKHIHKRQTHLLVREDYDRSGSVEKKILDVSLKGLGAKMNWLVVNRQSYSNFDFNSYSALLEILTGAHQSKNCTWLSKLLTCMTT
jgi:hypothetical protein